MAKDKEKKQMNPAAAALKKQKADALKKGKAQVLAQRNERLAQRNPQRLQRQIDELKQADEAGQLRPKDKQHLEQLERDLRAVNKARETLGTSAPKFGRREDDKGFRREFGDRDGSVLGKRRRDWKREDREPSSETDEGVRDIPMPTDHDNEPPIPRRARQAGNEGRGQRAPHTLPEKPVQAQTTYSSAPQIRDLQKEAVARFVPTAVAARKKLAQGQGRLMEPEEADALERQGYIGEAGRSSAGKSGAAEDDGELDEEEERFRREMDGLNDEGAGTMEALPTSRPHQAHVEDGDSDG